VPQQVRRQMRKTQDSSLDNSLTLYSIAEILDLAKVAFSKLSNELSCCSQKRNDISSGNSDANYVKVVSALWLSQSHETFKCWWNFDSLIAWFPKPLARATLHVRLMRFWGVSFESAFHRGGLCRTCKSYV